MKSNYDCSDGISTSPNYWQFPRKSENNTNSPTLRLLLVYKFFKHPSFLLKLMQYLDRTSHTLLQKMQCLLVDRYFSFSVSNYIFDNYYLHFFIHFFFKYVLLVIFAKKQKKNLKSWNKKLPIFSNLLHTT